jgi:hypothetical protein
MAEQGTNSNAEEHERSVKKGKWSEEEDELLRQAVEYYGEKHWRMISNHVDGRTQI